MKFIVNSYKFLFLCLTAIQVNEMQAQCPGADIYLNSMDELNQFAEDYPACSRLDHSLYITGEDIWTLIPIAGLDSVMGDLTLTAIGLVNNFSGINDLTYVGGDLHIEANPFLSNLSGLQGLTEVQGSLIIQNNPSLITLNGLNNLQETGGLKLLSLSTLSQVNALGQLESINGDLDMQANNVLTNITGLSGLMAIEGHLSITDCPMTDLLPFSNISQIGSSLYLIANSNLQSLNFNALSHIGGNLHLQDLDQLTSLEGLENLDLIQGRLAFISNANLSDILALDQAISITDSVIITGSPILDICDVQAICDHLEGSTAALFSGNGSGCNSVNTVQAACLSTGTQEESKTVFQVYPNPFSSSFIISSDHVIDYWALKDMLGRTVYSASVQQKEVPDLSLLPAGTYVLNVYESALPYVQLVTKE